MENKKNHINKDDLIRALAALPENQMPFDISGKVMDGIGKTEKPFAKRFSTLFYPAMAACAAMLIVAGILMFQGRATQAEAERLFADGVRMLSRGQLSEALANFENASEINPEDADVLFHLGMTHGKLDQLEQEQTAYIKTIRLDPDHVQAHYFLGHSYMGKAEWIKASDAYGKALALDPGLKKALFNKGLALKQSGKTDEAFAAWKSYLSGQKTGYWANRALAHLNSGGDFTYRAFQIGRQKMIMGPFSTGSRQDLPDVEDASLVRLAGSLEAAEDMDLFVTVFVDDHVEAAREQATAIKERLTRRFPSINPGRIKLSWFGQKDNVDLGNGQFSLEKSIRFLGVNRNILTKGVNS